MFLENLKANDPHRGHIEVICGSMFSGKTEELIRRLKRARIAKQKVEIFKPKVDTRYHEENVVSHDANFFDEELPSVCEKLANRGIRVMVAGLDMDYLGKPFGPIPGLVAIAEFVTKVHAICMKCGNLANYSHRTVANSSRILLGEQESYVPLCRACFNEEKEKNK